MTSLVIVLITTVGLTMGFNHFSSFALALDMKNSDSDDGDDGTKQQGQAEVFAHKFHKDTWSAFQF